MKHIAIIGGGISGLVSLHYLKQRFGDAVGIVLYEREPFVGGTIRSTKKDSCLFESGPNGFLDNQPDTLQLVRELGLEDQLITADATARRCYIQSQNALHPVPANPWEFIATPLWSLQDKCALIAGIFKNNISKECSIHDYISQRFSSNIADTLADPLMNGIWAGNIKRLHMASAFPRLKGRGLRKSRMLTFKEGMGQITGALSKRYQNHIKTDTEISSMPQADATVVAAPAYAASKIIENLNPVLAQILNQIPYAPMAVAGLVFTQDAFKKKPSGFGYLVGSKENKDVLGVLVESNAYSGRAGQKEVMIRVMMGGAHHPAIINDDHEQVLARAIKEIDKIYGLLLAPKETFVKIWPKAIPQYEINYPNWRKFIAQQCAKTPGLYLCANYLDGVSFNDCVRSAKAMAETVSI